MGFSKLKSKCLQSTGYLDEFIANPWSAV
uniref:Uncharacterized protein n=1 Tax=Anguilla anguilla TaxID=7936 RepID=A0A0E9PHU5_ANGAN